MEKLRKTDIHLIGAGGIGSPAALALAKMGVGSLTIWDDDSVEDHNLPNQLHKLEAVGQKKVDALVSLLNEFVGQEVNLTPKAERLNGQSTALSGIVISTVDSMESRKAIWEAVRASFGVDLYIDARMGGELLRLYALNPLMPQDADEYIKTLYSDEEALELPCTAQTIIYSGFVAGSLIAHTVRRHVSGERPQFEVVLDLTSYTLLTR